ncbi:MAG: alpha-L-glutamate ligase-like protein [Sphingopyxis sp.]|nr:alpha-L-glutamate ligase-like protein [Sphingopyxis sp.]
MAILGMNRRNALIQKYNSPRAIKTVNQKFETKTKLASAGVPVPNTLALIRSTSELMGFDFAALPESFAVKPNRGSQGQGVLLASGRESNGWRQLNGELLTFDMLRQHVARIQEGEFSLEGGDGDAALFEPLIRAHPEVARLVPYGLPDIRIICFRDRPLMAMTRLPTEESSGRANLHQGAIGAAIDLSSGEIFRAVLKGKPTEIHPSTGERLIGERIPFWNDVMTAARRCSAPLDLGYVGVDLVIDAVAGVQVLECNAYPGLEIQNVNGAGLANRIAIARKRVERPQRSEGLFKIPAIPTLGLSLPKFGIGRLAWG